MDSLETANSLTIELIYALPEEQELLVIQAPMGSTVEQAIELSGILSKYPEIDLTNTKVGIFSKVTKLNEVLRDGDRIEIYRPLIADPKEMRRKKALEKQQQAEKEKS
ncbi:MAG: RnfH family protein [Kangiellaceae bacterium]|nr:RnfH family protein [Kangiellaceae bacterium]MCW8998655.1 RnfH family protein [Kangiellaceae bacterium]MCW9017258.1 RnfH family protein [Kangiellaceae bacterium]